MIINTQEDLNAITGTSEYEQFIATLRGSLFTISKENEKWVATENNETIERFGLTRADFDPIALPTLPVNETQAELDAKASVEAEREAKNTGLPYLDTGITVPFTNEDAMGVLQVKAGFEMGLTGTVLYLSNGSKLPLTDAEFPDFSLWFMTNRSGFFTA